jgi:tetratricopeptide (TPR) repeat protein
MAKRSISKRKAIPDVQVGDEGVLTTEFVLPEWKLRLLHAAIIIAAGLWIYWPALHGGWLWDDDLYIYKNPLMNDPDRLWKAWFQPGSFMEYYPIEQTVQWFQWQLWHNDTFGYHLTNVILLIVSALLVWRLLGKFGLPLAWLGGLIFVSHPVNVESVAWVVELKNTLSLPPFLLAMCAWIDYEKGGRSRDYRLALGFFLVAMLCKITMFLFPVVILLYAWWKRGRIGWSDLRASAPFFVISFVLIEIAQGAGRSYGQGFQMGTSDLLPLGGLLSRIVLAGLALSFYFSNFFLPVELLPIYPVWKVDPPSLLQFLPWPVLAGVICWLWWKRKSWGRHALLGLGFFFLNVAPFLAFGLTFHPRDTWVMNHFLYIPMIGLIGVVVAAIGNMDQRLSTSAHPYSTGIITLVIVLLAFQSRGYAGAFINGETFWTYTLERNPGAWTAQTNLGQMLLMENKFDGAKGRFEAALRANPGYPEANADLGVTLVQMGRLPDGVEQFRKALSLSPNDAVTHNNLGIVLAQTGHVPEALQQFEDAIRVQPNYAQAYNNLGNAFLTMGRLDDAKENYGQALQINPEYAKAHDNLGNVLLKQGQNSGALEEFAKAVDLDPDDVKAHNHLGLVLAQMGRIPEAIGQFEAVLQLDPDNQVAQSNLAQLSHSSPDSLSPK